MAINVGLPIKSFCFYSNKPYVALWYVNLITKSLQIHECELILGSQLTPKLILLISNGLIASNTRNLWTYYIFKMATKAICRHQLIAFRQRISTYSMLRYTFFIAPAASVLVQARSNVLSRITRNLIGGLPAVFSFKHLPTTAGAMLEFCISNIIRLFWVHTSQNYRPLIGNQLLF